MKYIYIGFSDDMINKMLSFSSLELTGVITRRGKLSPDFLGELARKKIEVIFADNKEELRAAIMSFGDVLYIMYHFNIIVPDDIAQDHEIINIHDGDLRNNRGRNPISWSILLNEEKVTISVHRITGEIDKGILLDSITIPIEDSDDYVSLGKKVIETWADIAKSIMEYKTGNIQGVEITDGIYRRRITEDDYTIGKNDSPQTIIQKIKSQKGYRGAIIMYQNLKLYVSDYELKDEQ